MHIYIYAGYTIIDAANKSMLIKPAIPTLAMLLPPAIPAKSASSLEMKKKPIIHFILSNNSEKLLDQVVSPWVHMICCC